MKIHCTYQKPSSLIATFTILAIIMLFMRDGRISSEAAEKVKNQFENRFEFMSRRDVIWTAKGPVTYEEVDNNVFRPNNLKIVEYTYPIPRLDFIQKPSCAKTFEDWLAIASKEVPEIPPREIEEEYKNAFLLNGYTELHPGNYFNAKKRMGGVVWGNISTLMAASDPVVAYEKEGLAVHHALRKYPVKNMTGFVIGSQWAWVEVLALRSGAAEVLTVEYRETKIVGTERIKYVHPIKFAEQWSEGMGKFDFAISFSSIEHSGLGRYGDPIDPVGDLREAQKVLCLLKEGGCRFACPKNDSAQVKNHYG
ncbi:unnamed protein product [Cylicocyclus nassatus]|uniref:Uncharacterized protein n=1 Tax=Cylicocyclus nassatus TaxID=53992 RepID=A0AA36GF97_CYLNA|nr:unnamed protein product [Cylicocyclus nassatus]